jgi:hypothetical protein
MQGQSVTSVSHFHKNHGLVELTMFTIQPRVCGRTNALSGSICLPRTQFTAIGMPYEISSMTTDEEIMALNALQQG